MKKMFLRVIALILTICTMQVAFVPAVFAEATETSSVEKQAQPIVAYAGPAKQWKDGMFCSIATVDGHDYIALPLYGGTMYVYDLDELRLLDAVDIGIQTPRGAVVDENNVLWITGDASHIYKYDLKTLSGKTIPYVPSDVSMGSAFGGTYCAEDQCIYFGTYNKARVIKCNVNTDEIEVLNCDASSRDYITAVLRKGDYIYVSAHSDEQIGDYAPLSDTVQLSDYLLKIKATPNAAGKYETVAIKRMDDQLARQRYLHNLQMLDENIIVGGGTGVMYAVNTDNEMEILDADDFGGEEFAIKYAISEVKDNKVYFVEYNKGLLAYDRDTKAISVVSPGAGGNPLQCIDQNFVTLNVKDGKVVSCYEEGAVEEECVVTYVNSKTALNFTTVDTEKGVKGYIINNGLLIDADAGASTGLHSVAAGLPGSNEIYMGAFQRNKLYVYNTATGELTHALPSTSTQTDALHWYNNQLYAGNYTVGQLTKIDLANKLDVIETLNSKYETSTALVSLNDTSFTGTSKEIFDQARVHTITSGDNKVFFGTIPDLAKTGGVIAWYDLDTSTGYVAIGPDADDVYFSTDNTKWYHEQTYLTEGTKVEITPAVLDSYNHIEGVIYKHSINTLVYYDDGDGGILFGTSSKQGGTNSGGNPTGGNAVLFAYDVKNRTVLKKDDLSSMGMPALGYVGGIAADPDVDGKFWAIANEVLFTFTFNKTTKTFSLEEQLVFNNKQEAVGDGGRYTHPRPILFADENKDGVSEYIYVAFSGNGKMCKIEKSNPQNYKQLATTIVPMYYTLGDDGCLYYADGKNLCMLNVTPTDTDWAKAESIDTQFENGTDIFTTYAAYNGLKNREKSLVQNADAIVDLAIATTKAQIAAIGSVTSHSGPAITAARAAYDSLEQEHTSKVTNYSTLLSAEYAYANLHAADIIKADETVVAYKSLEAAIAAAESGDTIQLLEDASETTVNVPNGAVLDLNGCVLETEYIAGNVKDSGNGNGLIKLDNAQQATDLTSPADQLILWDNTSGNTGYRVFNYTFTNLNEDADGTDVSESDKAGVTVKSFWSYLAFTNPYAYSLVESTYSNLQVGFQVSWTPVNGTPGSKIFELPSSVIMNWAKAELDDESKNWGFYIRLTGFDDLTMDGSGEIKPILKTRFNETERAATKFEFDVKDPLDILEFQRGFGDLDEIS